MIQLTEDSSSLKSHRFTAFGYQRRLSINAEVRGKVKITLS